MLKSVLDMYISMTFFVDGLCSDVYSPLSFL